jgi:hypothetical protein
LPGTNNLAYYKNIFIVKALGVYWHMSQFRYCFAAHPDLECHSAECRCTKCRGAPATASRLTHDEAKSFLTVTPMANVIKLFTAVSYGFSF